MNDKDKSVISKLVDTVTNAVGGAVKAAVMPTVDPKEEVVAEKLRADAGWRRRYRS
jgi:hypothetical protein